MYSFAGTRKTKKYNQYLLKDFHFSNFKKVYYTRFYFWKLMRMLTVIFQFDWWYLIIIINQFSHFWLSKISIFNNNLLKLYSPYLEVYSNKSIYFLIYIAYEKRDVYYLCLHILNEILYDLTFKTRNYEF